MEQFLIVMIGLPGSGKSTMGKKLAEEYNAEIVSTDSIRKEFLGREGDRSEDSKVFATAHNRCENLLRQGKSVVFDACNLSVGARQRVLKCAAFSKNIRKIGYVMAADAWRCIENDKKRERQCGASVILSCAESYVYPRIQEGFNEMIRQKMQEMF